MAEREAQREELVARVEALEAKLAPLDADRAELAGRARGLERRLKEADAARSHPQVAPDLDPTRQH